MKAGTAKQAIAALFAGGMLGGLLMFPSSASAWWVRQHGSDCSRVSSNYVDTGNGAGLNSTVSGYVCAVPDTSSTPKTALASANVEVWNDSSGFWSAKPCFADWDGQTGGCDTAITTSGTGHKSIPLGGGNGFWDTDTGADFGYIAVIPASSGGTNRIAGIFYSN